jgi:hypothetical protein
MRWLKIKVLSLLVGGGKRGGGGGMGEEGGFWEKHFSLDCLLVFRYCIVQCACRSEGQRESAINGIVRSYSFRVF